MVIPVFYEVVGITASGKSAKIRRLDTKDTYTTDGFTGMKVPADTFRSEVIETRRIKVAEWDWCDPYEYVSASSCNLRPWDGKPKHYDFLD